jgi:multidrug efflux system outer membrane protein
MKAVELAYRSQLLSYESARTQLAVETAQSFYRLIRDRRNLENLQNLRDLAVRHFEQNRTGFNNGIVSQVVFLQSQLRAEEARLSLSRAEAAYTSGLGAFLVSLGLDQYLDVSLRGEIAIERLEVDPERLIAEYLPKRPDLLSRRQEIERLDLLSRTNALDARFPVTLSLSAGLGQAGSGLPGGWDTTMPLSGSLRVSIPLNPWIPGTTANQALRAARTEAETARLNLQEAENQARLTVRTLTEELRTSWAVIEIARLRLEIAERAYSLSEQGYRSGTVDSLSLAESRNSMAQARQDLLSGEYDYLSMILQLSAALNLDWNELRNLP